MQQQVMLSKSQLQLSETGSQSMQSGPGPDPVLDVELWLVCPTVALAFALPVPPEPAPPAPPEFAPPAFPCPFEPSTITLLPHAAIADAADKPKPKRSIVF